MSTTELSKKTKRSLHQEKEVYLRKEDRNFLNYFSEQTVQMIIINLFDINLEITYIANNFKKELKPMDPRPYHFDYRKPRLSNPTLYL